MRPQLLTYPIPENIVAFSTTRHAGFSKGNYAAFNINAYCGDDAEAIKHNREILCNEIGVADDMLVTPHQVHGTEGTVVDADFLRLDLTQCAAELEGKDYVATNLKGVCVAVSTADCVPVLMYSDMHSVVAAIHAGWRGTLKRITMKAAISVAEHFHAEPCDFKAIIGPSISLKAFEVGDEVYDAFESENFEMNRIAVRMGGKWHIDLWKANAMQLEKAGVKEENIYLSGICTYEHSDDFFSARRLGINSGRITSGILMR